MSLNPDPSPAGVRTGATPRSRRDRPAKAPLSREVVVDAALALLKRGGPDAVSMRRVADALDTGAASLYVYVSGRDGLLEAMLARVTAQVELEAPDPARWRSQLHDLLSGLLRALTDHPGMAAMTLADPPHTGPVLEFADTLLGLLLAGGLAPRDAAWAGDAFVALVHAAAREDDVRRPAGPTARAELERSFSELPGERFPHLSAHAAAMVEGDSRQRWAFAVDAMLDGILRRG